MRNRTFPPKFFVPAFIAIMGFIAFSNMASSPRFATFRTVDVVRLMASGMCFGAALVAAGLTFFAGPRSD